MENGIKSSGRQIPTFTVILAVLLSAGTALIAHDVFDGWLWLSLSAGFGAVAAFISGIRVLALAPLLGSIASAVIYAPFVPAWSAAAALLALLICLSAEGRMTKNVSLIASAAALILLGLLQFAADAYNGGELSWTAIWNEIKAPFSVMRDSLLSSAEAMEKSGGQIYGVSVGELTAAFRQMKASMLRVLPSIVIVTALFIGWLAHGIFGGCIRFLAPPQLDKRGKVTMSLTAAVIFTLSYLASAIFGASSDNSLTAVSAENMAAVLAPGFFAVGFGTLLSGAKRRTGGGAMFAIIVMICIGALISSVGIAAILFVLIGVIHTFRAAAAARRKEE